MQPAYASRQPASGALVCPPFGITSGTRKSPRRVFSPAAQDSFTPVGNRGVSDGEDLPWSLERVFHSKAANTGMEDDSEGFGGENTSMKFDAPQPA